MARTALIVGASRGIGLGLAREFAGRGWAVTATVRGDAPDGLDGVRVEQLELTNAVAGKAMAANLGAGALDLLFINAGTFGPGEQSPETLIDEDVARVMTTNAVGPVRLAMQLLPAMRDGGTIAFMTSRVGSVADNDAGGMDLYRASKAALNSMTRGFVAKEVGRRPLAVLSLHPGWVATDMGGANAPLSVEDSARGLADVVEREAGKPGHRFLDYQGKTIPW